MLSGPSFDGPLNYLSLQVVRVVGLAPHDCQVGAWRYGYASTVHLGDSVCSA